MRKEFGKDSVILLRTHYYIADSLDLTGLEDFVYNGSTYNDVSRLYLASDICIFLFHKTGCLAMSAHTG